MTPRASLDALLADPTRAAEIPSEQVPALLGELERLRAALWVRLVTAPTETGSASAPEPDGDRLLTAQQAAEVAAVSPKWLYRRAARLPFARRLDQKTVRFSERGLRKWLAAQRG